MDGRPLHDWTRLIRKRADGDGTTLSEEVLAELAEHLEDVYEDHIHRGCGASEAYLAAGRVCDAAEFYAIAGRRRALVLTSRLTDRGAPAAAWWHGLGCDARYACRSMRRAPAFSIAVVAILAVAIGAATAAFSVIDTVLLRALPYPDARQLVMLKHVTPAGESRSHSAADWRDYASRHAGIIELAAYASWPMNVTGGGPPERLRSFIVSGNFFDVIGRAAALGRVTHPADDTPEAPPVVVLSHGFWQRRFGADPSAVGKPIVLNGRAATVVGVAPADFALPDRAVDLWMPMGLPPAVLDDRASEWLSVLGRLRSDIRRAQADLSATAAVLSSTFPATNADERVAIRPLLDEMVGGVRRALWLGAVAVLFVLLAASANAANLMIARATLRQDEIAIRAALGAEPFRIARQLLVESLMLASCGGALGIGAAYAFGRAFIALADDRVPRIDQLQLNGAALVVAILTAAGSAMVFGGAAAWVLIRRHSGGAARSGVRVTSATRLAGAMLAGQVAFALVLIAGALLVALEYMSTRAIDPGFEVSDVLTMQVTLPRSRYANAEAHARFAARAVAELAAMPGVAGVGVVSDMPLEGNALHFPVRDDEAAGEGERMTVRPADEGFFPALRIGPSDGRLFTVRDRRGGPLVAVLNQTAAKRFGPHPVGHRIVIAGEPPRLVVGIVRDIRHGGLHAVEGPVVYVPFAQKTFDFQNWMGIVARGTAVAPSAAGVRAAIARIDPDQPLSAVQLMSEALDGQTAPYRFSALVVWVLAGAALLLAVTGIYGLTAFVVGRRTRELGVRLALGATPLSVIWLVLKQVIVIVAAGSLAGLAAAALTNTLLQATLAGDTSLRSNVLTAIGGFLLLLMTAIGSALIPAVRAARIDPKSALQAE